MVDVVVETFFYVSLNVCLKFDHGRRTRSVRRRDRGVLWGGGYLKRKTYTI